jgi:hypothetical protein
MLVYNLYGVAWAKTAGLVAFALNRLVPISDGLAMAAFVLFGSAAGCLFDRPDRIAVFGVQLRVWGLGFAVLIPVVALFNGEPVFTDPAHHYLWIVAALNIPLLLLFPLRDSATV